MRVFIFLFSKYDVTVKPLFTHRKPDDPDFFLTLKLSYE